MAVKYLNEGQNLCAAAGIYGLRWDEEEGPNYVQVTDSRNWSRLAIECKANGQFQTDEAQQLKGAELRLEQWAMVSNLQAPTRQMQTQRSNAFERGG